MTTGNKIEVASADKIGTTVGFNFTLWTSLQCPNELMYQIRQRYVRFTEHSFEEGSPLLCTAWSQIIGVYAHGREVLFTPATLNELDRLSEMNYTTARYSKESLNGELITIPLLCAVNNLKRIDLSNTKKDIGNAPLRCQGAK